MGNSESINFYKHRRRSFFNKNPTKINDKNKRNESYKQSPTQKINDNLCDIFIRKKIKIDDFISPLEENEQKTYKEENIIQYYDDLIDLTCPICLNILNNPIYCSSNTNSHSFGKECIDIYMKSNSKCPICKKNFEYKTNNKRNEILYKICFECPNKDNGCEEIISYLNYFNHIKECKYRKVLYECQIDKYNYTHNDFEKCLYKGTYKEINEHFNKCELSLVKCVFCTHEFLKIHSKEHYQKYCNIEIKNYNNIYKCIKTKNGSFCKFSYNDGDIYKGALNGFGQYFCTNGDKYEGEIKKNSREGYGIQYFSDGISIYEGEFKYNYINGCGIFIYSNGVKYEGEWKNNKKDGYGTLYDKNVLYYGEFKKDKIEGYGICIYSNGEKYEGEWKNNCKEGFGVLYHVNGNKTIGKWRNDKLLINFRLKEDLLNRLFSS